MRAFLESKLFSVVMESILTVAFLLLILFGNYSGITVVLLAASAFGAGWHLRDYLNERNARVKR